MKIGLKRRRLSRRLKRKICKAEENLRDIVSINKHRDYLNIPPLSAKKLKSDIVEYKTELENI